MGEGDVAVNINLITIFFFNDTATTEIYTLSLHDALPICVRARDREPARHARHLHQRARRGHAPRLRPPLPHRRGRQAGRESTRLKSSLPVISYFGLFFYKKKK